MYEELVKRLHRYTENCVAYKLDADFADAVQQAADAIEKLQKRVPPVPHGRLIDADKIGLTDFEIILCQKGNPFKNALEMLLEKIENVPTVVEAEENKI